MTALSAKQGDDPFLLVANPVFPITQGKPQRGQEFVFEIMQVDAKKLITLVGLHCFYHLDGSSFWAVLNKLEPAASEHPGVAHLRNKPVLRGVFTVLGDTIAEA